MICIVVHSVFNDVLAKVQSDDWEDESENLMNHRRFVEYLNDHWIIQ
jgi:hypothetical protein